MDATGSFLGTGWGFPPEFNQASGDVLMTSDIPDIIGSLTILLSTSLGERLMQPTYGCNLSDLVFERMNASMTGRVREIVKDAILYHEARIRPNNISVDSSRYLEGMLRIEIDFTVSATNSRYNFVYPYYINEAGSVAK